MKIVLRPHHIISLAGYIVELRVPFRNLIVVNPTDEEIKLEVPVLYEGWIEDHRDLGLEVTPVYDDDNFLVMYQMAKQKLDDLIEEEKKQAEQPAE
jgi:energy-converting hydrogenase B subunit P